MMVINTLMRVPNFGDLLRYIGNLRHLKHLRPNWVQKPDNDQDYYCTLELKFGIVQAHCLLDKAFSTKAMLIKPITAAQFVCVHWNLAIVTMTGYIEKSLEEKELNRGPLGLEPTQLTFSLALQSKHCLGFQVMVFFCGRGSTVRRVSSQRSLKEVQLSEVVLTPSRGIRW